MTAAHPFSALIKYSFSELQENTDETISLHCFMKILHSHKTYRDSLQYTCCFRQVYWSGSHLLETFQDKGTTEADRRLPSIFRRDPHSSWHQAGTDQDTVRFVSHS